MMSQVHCALENSAGEAPHGDFVSHGTSALQLLPEILERLFGENWPAGFVPLIDKVYRLLLCHRQLLTSRSVR